MRKVVSSGYRIGDARNLPVLLPQKEFVDVTVTSPPYWNLKDYGSRRQIGFGQTYSEYLDSLEGIFASIFRITKRTGSLWIVADTLKCAGSVRLFPFDLAARLANVGWLLQDIIIWHKNKTLPWSHRGKLRNIFEYVLFFSKSNRFKYDLSKVRETNGLKRWWVRYPERYSPNGKAPTRTWIIDIPTQGSWSGEWVRHFCPLPPDMVRRIILMTTRKGDVFLDPFAGSGVGLAEAAAHNRVYLGVDLSQRSRRMFERKVLPAIKLLERKRSAELAASRCWQRKFSRLIWRLRKTKYARELIRLYLRRYGRIPVSSVLAMSAGCRRLDLYFVVGHRRVPGSFQKRIESLMRHAPLSKYGLRVTASVLPKRPPPGFVAQGVAAEAKLAVYSATNTHAFDHIATAADLTKLTAGSNGSSGMRGPLIASDIRVKINGLGGVRPYPSRRI